MRLCFLLISFLIYNSRLRAEEGNCVIFKYTNNVLLESFMWFINSMSIVCLVSLDDETMHPSLPLAASFVDRVGFQKEYEGEI